MSSRVDVGYMGFHSDFKRKGWMVMRMSQACMEIFDEIVSARLEHFIAKEFMKKSASVFSEIDDNSGDVISFSRSRKMYQVRTYTRAYVHTHIRTYTHAYIYTLTHTPKDGSQWKGA